MLGHIFHLHVGAQLLSLLASSEPKYHLSPFLLCLNLCWLIVASSTETYMVYVCMFQCYMYVLTNIHTSPFIVCLTQLLLK